MNRDLQFRFGYYNDPVLREGLNALVREAFGGFDFTPWNDLGYAFKEYTPFSYVDGARVVANVSCSPMKLLIGGKQVATTQIGTVATSGDYRGQGLIRSLMQRALDHWKKTHALTFLFANETTEDFYQQFGFRRVGEHGFSAPAPGFEPSKVPARNLSLDKAADRELLRDLALRRSPVSRTLGVYDEAWLLLFHAAVAYPRNLVYIESLDVAVICMNQAGTLRLIDVIGEVIPPLHEIYPYVGSRRITSIEFGFTPDMLGKEPRVSSAPVDSLFFVRGPFDIESERFLFPLCGQA